MRALRQSSPRLLPQLGRRLALMSSGPAKQADPASFTSVTEGLATIYFPSEKGVFYNPPQIPNRDLSVLVLSEFARVWEEEQAAKAHKASARAAAAAARKARNGPTHEEGATSSTPTSQNDPFPSEATHPPSQAASSSLSPSQTSLPVRAEAERDAPAGEGASAECKLRVLDAMTASGLRAIRYALEVPQVTQVVANDLEPAALEALQENLRRNGLGEERVVSNLGDAVSVMHSAKPPTGERFEVVELDPYGTAAPFLDSAMQCVAEGGLLMVTCTDLAVLCGMYPEACHAKYGSYCLKAKYCHEAALRIVLSCMEDHANRHRRYIVPLVSMHINFYVRVCVRVYTSPSQVKLSPTKKSLIYQCSGCDTFTLQPVARRVIKGDSEKVVAGQGPPVDRYCAHCGFVHHMGGPIWSAPTSDPAFVAKLLRRLEDAADCTHLGARKRVAGMLTSVSEELEDVPLFLQLAQMCSVLHTSTPPLLSYISALMRQGYRVSRSHTDPGAIKTDAPPRAQWDVLRCWCRSQKRSNPLSETSPAHRILSQEPLVEADFNPTPEALALLSKRDADGAKVSRFLPNPDEWGPGSKATCHAEGASSSSTPTAAMAASALPGTEAGAIDSRGAMLEKRARNQNKRARKRQAREGAGGEQPADAVDAEGPQE